MATEQAIITAFFAFHLSSLSLTEPLETLNVHPKDETEQKCYFKFDRFLAQLKTLLQLRVFAIDSQQVSLAGLRLHSRDNEMHRGGGEGRGQLKPTRDDVTGPRPGLATHPVLTLC